MACALLQTQAIQLSDSLPVPLFVMGWTENYSFLVLFPKLCAGKQFGNIPLLAVILLPCCSSVHHIMPFGVILCTGESKIELYNYHVIPIM